MRVVIWVVLVTSFECVRLNVLILLGSFGIVWFVLVRCLLGLCAY